MTSVLTIIRKELRATIWAPLGLLACLALITCLLHWQHYWDNRVVVWYTFAVGLLGLYMGAEAVCGDTATRFAQWQGQWPLSRTKWWLLRLLLQAAVTFLCGGLAYAMLAWLAAWHAPNPAFVHPGLSSVWAGGLTIIPAFIVAFFASSVCRTSVQAFFLAIGLSWGLAIVASFPMMARMMTAGMTGRMPSLPSPALYLIPSAVTCLALLLGSLYGFISTPPLEFGKRAGRAFGVLLAIVIPVTLVLSAYGLYSGVRGTGHGGPFAHGGPSSAPSGISAARISPDGQRIAFTDGVFEQTLWVVNADGSNLRQILPQRVDDFLWLRDSRRIAASTQLRQRTQPSRPVGSRQTEQQRQWSVLDTDAKRPTPVPILQTAQSGSRMSRLSPQGKYLWLDGHFVEVDTWKSVGEVKVPNHSPWFLTWLPDDSAIYVYEHRFQGFPPAGPAALAQMAKSRTSPLKRISVPSGETTDAQLPQGAVTDNRYDPYRVAPLSESSNWCSADRSTYVGIPFDQQPVIYRSTSVRGLNNTESRRTYADPITRRRHARTLLYQLGGTRRLQIDGLEPCHGGLSPSGRYCLMNVAGGVTEYDDREDWHAAVVDMTTGNLLQRVTLPGLTSMDRSEGNIRWSPDEQWVAQVVERWDDKARWQELLLGSVRGESKKLKLGDVDGWGDSGVIGWTAADQFVVIREQSTLVGIGVDGQEQVLVRSEKPWYEKAAEHSSSRTPTRSTVTRSATSTVPGATPAGAGQPVTNAAPPVRTASVASKSDYTEPTPQTFIASVLGFKPGQVTGVTPVIPQGSYYSSQRGFEWEGRVNGQTIHVSSAGPGQWSLRTPKTAAPVAGTVTVDQARVKAKAVLHGRFGAAADQMTENNVAELGRAGFMFSWTGRQDTDTHGASAQLTLDAAGKVKSCNERRTVPAVAEPAPLAATEIQETPEHFAAAILGVPASEIPAPSSSGTSWWVYQIRGRTYHVEHPPFRWGLQLWSDHAPGKTISAANARETARGLVNRRLSQNATPGATLTWKDGKIAQFSFDCKETLGPNLLTGDSASVVLFPDGTLMTYEERRVLPKLRLADVKITRAKARQIADNLVHWGEGAEHTRYTFKRMWLDMRSEPFNNGPYGPVWSFEYTPAGTAEDWRRIRPRFGYIRIDGMTGKVTQP